MTARYAVVLHPELRKQLIALSRAAEQEPGGLQDQEFRAVRQALTALRDGQEATLRGERLGYSRGHHDLRDCAEVKVAVVREFRHGRELGPSHRLIYREHEGQDGSPPIRQAIAFEARADGRPFAVAGRRLGRELGVRQADLAGLPTVRPVSGADKDPAGPAGPPRLPLPADLADSVRLLQGSAPAADAPKVSAAHPRPPGDRGGQPYYRPPREP